MVAHQLKWTSALLGSGKQRAIGLWQTQEYRGEGVARAICYPTNVRDDAEFRLHEFDAPSERLLKWRRRTAQMIVGAIFSWRSGVVVQMQTLDDEGQRSHCVFWN
jgi:hypothetical protein